MSGTNRPPRPQNRASASKSAGKKPGQKSGQKAGPKPSGKEQFRTWLRRLLVLGVVGTVLMVAIAYFAYRATEIPDPNADFQTQTTNVYYKGGKTKLGQFATQNRESIPLADVPQVMQDAIIAAEDKTFWTNKGIDPKGILRAAFSNAQGNDTQGASTITQQYVKVLYLTQERTLKRKVKEAFLSLKVQQEQSKSAILEGYLNTIYFGRGAYGIEAASQAYFGKRAKQLRLGQAAMLSALVNSPNFLNPDRSADAREALKARYQVILKAMVDAGSVDQAAVDKVYDRLPKRLKPNRDNQYGGQRGFMLAMVKSELLELGFDESSIEGGGLRVTTTFTKKAMEASRDAVLAQRPEGLKGLHTATASIDVKSGGLLGFYGGQDYLKSQLNWALLGNAPGSSFKPFALAAGIDEGFSLKDTFEGNSPLEVGDIEIENQGEDGGSDYGSSVSLIKATEDSINTAYVDLTQSMDDGPQKVVDMAKRLGVPKNARGLEPNTTVSLGSATVGVIDMANAYSTIANGGVRHDWFVVDRVVRASDGEELYKAPRKKKRAVSEDLAADVSYALQRVVTNGYGTKALALDRPSAGKTGTATKDGGEVVSSWYVGYTPQVATAVMYTRGNGRQPLDDFLVPFFGSGYPLSTWVDVMDTIMDGMDVEEFPEPAYLDGEAPTSGHEPYTPPPPPPSPTPKPKPSETPKPSPTPTPTTEEPFENGVCSDFGYPADPDCPKPEPTLPPSQSPSPTEATDACPDVPGDQPEGTDCTSQDGRCSKPIANPDDIDCQVHREERSTSDYQSVEYRSSEYQEWRARYYSREVAA